MLRLVQRSIVSTSGRIASKNKTTTAYLQHHQTLTRVMSREMASKTGERVETDTMGEMRVQADRYWGAQTQRSKENFRIGDEKTERMPVPGEFCIGYYATACGEHFLHWRC
jgi:hypothetical protein